MMNGTLGLKLSKGRVRLATGTYTGDAVGDGQMIATPFKPKHVQVYETDGNKVNAWNKNDEMAGALAYKWTEAPTLATANEIVLKPRGFLVGVNANLLNQVYEWTAWG